MSTQGRQPRQPRQPTQKTTKNATAQPEPVQQAAPVEAAPQPQVEPTVVVAEAAPVTQEKTKLKAIASGISAARVRRHLDKMNINAMLEEESKAFKTKIKSFDTAKSQLESKTVPTVETIETDGKKKNVAGTRPATEDELAEFANTVKRLGPEIPDAKARLVALARERIRIAGESSLVVKIVLERLITQLATHAMDRALLAKKKIITIGHLHEDGITKLSMYSLFEPLPSFRRHADKISKAAHEVAVKEHDMALIAEARKSFKREFALQLKNAKPVPQTTPVVKPAEPTPQPLVPEVEDENEQDSKTSFKFYVSTVCSNLTKRPETPQYNGIRFSTDLKSYLSDILVELIQRLSGLVLLTAGSMKNKTIGNVAIMRTIESLMTDGHKPVESIEFKEGQIRDPSVIESENTKRKEAEKAGQKYEGLTVSKIPMVTGLVAHRVVKYPTSGYEALHLEVAEKLAQYEALSADAKKALDGSKDKEVQ